MNIHKVSAAVTIRVTDKIYGANTAEDAERVFLAALGDMLLYTRDVEMELISADVSLDAGAGAS
jgi:hypothetical protein